MLRDKKLNFLKVLGEIDYILDIKKDLSRIVNEKLEGIDTERKKTVALDIVEGFENNEEMLTELITQDNLNIKKLIETFDGEILSSENQVMALEEKHIKLFLKALTNDKIPEKESINFIGGLKNKINNEKDNIVNYIIGHNLNSQIKTYLENEKFFDIVFIHLLNLCKKESEFINRDEGLITLVYFKISAKLGNFFAIPISIIAVLLHGSNLPQNNFIATQIGKITMNHIFEGALRFKESEYYFLKYLQILDESKLLYEFLDSLKSYNISDSYSRKIAKLITNSNLLHDHLIINFYIFLKKYYPDIEDIIDEKNKENKFWFKENIKYNLEKDFATDDTIQFLISFQHWTEDKEILETVKDYIEANGKDLTGKEVLFELSKMLMEKGIKFNMGFSNDLGEALYTAFKEMLDSHEIDQKALYIFKNLDKFMERNATEALMNSIESSLIHANWESITDTEINAIKAIKNSLHISKENVMRIFNSIISQARNNPASWRIFEEILDGIELSEDNTKFIKSEIEKMEKDQSIKDEIKEITSKIKEKVSTLEGE